MPEMQPMKVVDLEATGRKIEAENARLRRRGFGDKADAMAQVISLLRSCTRLAARDQSAEMILDRLCWRVADAAGRLRDVTEHIAQRDNWTTTIGLEEPTGLGCVLPTIPPDRKP